MIFYFFLKGVELLFEFWVAMFELCLSSFNELRDDILGGDDELYGCWFHCIYFL